MNRYLVIGSGLIGRLLSWRLIKADHQVDILSSDDRIGSDSAAFIAASMISPLTEAVSTEAAVKKIGLHSMTLWPKWLAELPESVFYPQHGTLVVAHVGDQADMLRFKKRANHVLEPDDFQSLSHEQLGLLEPELADNFDNALLFEQEACLDNRHLFKLLGAELSQHCNWQHCQPIIQINDDTLNQLSNQYFGHTLNHYDAVIDCRGNGARQDLSSLRSVRGEIVRVSAPEVNIKHTVRLIHPRYPLYLAPRPNHEYVLGATVIESDDRSPVSIRSGLELMSAVYSLHKGFSEARILEMAAHCRPAFNDNMPSIIRTEWGFHINGLYRHGYLFSPAIVNDMLQILDDQADKTMFGAYYHV